MINVNRKRFTDRGEVRDGGVVRVRAALPHPVDQQLRQVEEDRHLQRGRQQVEEQEQRRGRGEDLHREDDEHKDGVAGEEEAQ